NKPQLLVSWGATTPPPPPPPPPAGTRTVAADADALVAAATPTQNDGAGTALSADQSPETESYLRFTVGGVTEAVLGAEVRLFVTDKSSDGPALYRAGNTWTESGITWANRPARSGGVLAD